MKQENNFIPTVTISLEEYEELRANRRFGQKIDDLHVLLTRLNDVESDDQLYRITLDIKTFLKELKE